MSEISFYKVPILDKEEKIFGYEIKSEESSLEEVLAALLERLDFEDISEGKLILIKATKDLIEKDVLSLLDLKKVILEIDSTLLDDNTLNYLKTIKPKLAYLSFYIEKEEDFKNLETIKDILDIVSTKLDNVNLLENVEKEKLLKDVNKREDFEKYKNLANYFEGFFFEEPKIVKEKSLSPYESTLITLINKLSNPNVDIDEIEKIIKSDVNLTVNLLKFVNSPLFGFRKEITSIKQAITILGIKNLHKWAFLLLFAKDKSSTENPVFSMALIRSKIMEGLASYLLQKKKVSDPEFPEKAYLVGLLSLIDAMLQKDKNELLEKLNVSQEIKEAVLEEKGELGELLRLTKEIEKGSLFSLKPKIEKKGIPIDKALAIRFQAYKYAREVLKSLK